MSTRVPAITSDLPDRAVAMATATDYRYPTQDYTMLHHQNKDNLWSVSVDGQIESICGFEEYRSNYLRCIVHLALPEQWEPVQGDHCLTSIVTQLTQDNGTLQRAICLPFQMHLKLNTEASGYHRVAHPRLIALILDENDQEVGAGFASLPLSPGRFNLRILTSRKAPVTLRDRLEEVFLSGSIHQAIEKKGLFVSLLDTANSHASSRSLAIKEPSFAQVNQSHGSVEITVNVLTTCRLVDERPVDPIEQIIEAFKRAKAKLTQLREDIHHESLLQVVRKGEETVDGWEE